MSLNITQILYVAETILAFCVGHVAKGLANNNMTDEARASLSPDDPEYQLRFVGTCVLAGP